MERYNLREVSVETPQLRAVYGEDTIVVVSGELHRNDFLTGSTFHGNVDIGPDEWIRRRVIVRLQKNHAAELEFTVPR